MNTLSVQHEAKIYITRVNHLQCIFKKCIRKTEFSDGFRMTLKAPKGSDKAQTYLFGTILEVKFLVFVVSFNDIL